MRARGRPYPPLYVASSFAGAGLAAAARYGAGLLLLGVGHASAPRFRAAERVLADTGSFLDRDRVVVVLNMRVGRSRREAIEAIRHGAIAEQREYWNGTVGMPAPDYPLYEHAEQMVERGLLIAGSPGECIDALRALLGALGPIGGLLVAAREWSEADDTAHHWKLLAGEVAPAFQDGLDDFRAFTRGTDAARREELV